MTTEEYLVKVEESQQEILHRVFFTDTESKPLHKLSGQLFLVGENLIRQLKERLNEQANG